MTDIQKELSGIIETYCNELIGADASVLGDYSFSEKYLKRKQAIISQMGSPKRRGGIRLKVIIALIAAVLALAVPVGTYAYNTFIHKKNVELFLNNADDLDRFAVNHVMENEHLRRTVDIMLSDGHNVLTVETQEYKDDIGEQFVRGVIQGHYLLTYTDKTAGPYSLHPDFPRSPYVWMASTLSIPEKTGDRKIGRISAIYSCEGIDLEKELSITYFANGDKNIIAEQYFKKRFPELNWYYNIQDGEPDNWLEGFEYVTSFAPNVECVPLHSEDGTEIFMSQFELFCESEEAESVFDTNNYYFILKNGEKRPFQKNYSRGSKDYQTFGEVIDLDGYAGVEIGGVQYLK